jgi:hypothetical protein
MAPELQNILDTYKTKNNKELSIISVQLFNDFQAIKESMLILFTNMNEIEKVYNAVYGELQNRLKFEEPKE